MTSEPAISAWPDVEAIEKDLDRLIHTPIRRLSDERLAEYHAWYEANAAGSKATFDEAQLYIPGGVQHNLALNDPWALDIVRADGAHLWDVDGNRYIDF